MDGTMKEIDAKIGFNSYKIQIGHEALLKSKELRAVLDVDKFAIMLSNNVYDMHWEYLSELFGEFNRKELFLVQDIEENKNFASVEKFLEGFVDKGLTRDSLVWSIGGGVVGDFSGFCASIYMRGIPFVQTPTTLLAMVDASIGGKVAVNIHAGKNLVGSFHQPLLVVNDTIFLSTLSIHEIKSGLAEILKHALIGDSATLDLLLKHDLKSVQNLQVLEELIFLSAAFKVSVVAEDENEQGRRAILNFGHTVGHAIESVMQYKDVSHGEAVAAGILAESRISNDLGLLDEDNFRLIKELLQRYELITDNIRCNPEELLRHMYFDKKNKNGSIRFVLLQALGSPMYDKTVPDNIILNAVSDFELR